METFLASLPIFVLATLLLGMGWRLISAAPMAFISAVLVAVGWWSIPFEFLLSAVTKGLFLSLDIMLIVFGAVFFIQYLRRLGLIRALEAQLRNLSPDRRVQAILLAWLLGGFIEGTAGFGTPAVIVAPLLVAIGFPATTAIMICLVANSTSVAFGAVGTPIRIGFSDLETSGVAVSAALINLFVGFIVPVVILLYVISGEARNRWQTFTHGLPWALFAGGAFLLPYYLFSYLGHEFPSLLGAAVGLVIASLSIKLKILVPREPLIFVDATTHESSKIESKTAHGFARAIMPYVLLLGLLLIGKFVFARFHLRWNMSGGLAHTFQSFNPGFAFITVIAALAVYYRTRWQTLMELASTAMKPLGTTAISIFFVSATTYTMIVTGAMGTDGMMETLTRVFVSPGLPFYSPFIGALGSFLAGSATVSNLLFGTVQMEAAVQTGHEVKWILALQLVGAGAGNMIALPNLLAVQAAVGISGEESRLLRRLMIPCVLYLLVSALVGSLLM